MPAKTYLRFGVSSRTTMFEQRMALVDRLDRAFALLAMNPKSGRARADIGKGIRSFVVGQYVVFYRAVPGGIDVARVMHGARNIVPDDIWRSLAIDED